MSTLPPEASTETLAGEIRRLGHILGDTIVKLEGKGIFDLEEKLRLLAKSSRGGDTGAEKELRAAVQQLTAGEAARMAMAFTVYFELVNLAEETHRVRILRRRRHEQYAVPGTPPMKETIWAALRELKAQGVPPETVQQILDKLSIELVFTAHPTEAKRRTMLNKLQRLGHRLQNPDALLEDEITGITNPRALEREVTSLWLTDRSRSARPEVTDEVLTGLWYFDTTLWNTVPLLRDELARALADTYPGLKPPKRWITFGSWMGGDRDGNPNVTPAVTAKTLMLHRKLALDKLEGSLRELSRLLSVSSRLDAISPELQKMLPLGDNADPKLKALHDRYPYEPYRLVLSALRSRLQDAGKTESPELLLAPEGNTAPTTVTTKDVTDVLEVIAESLKANRAGLLAEGELYRLRQQVTLFGLSVARLDLRQHSMRHETAMTELLKSVGVCPDYAALSEEEKLALMRKVLAAPAPKLPGGYTPETTDVVGSLAVI
jgi:phosphoenolpyruvate carboxylase